MSRLHLMLALGLALGAALPAQAQTVWIGRPTIGDVMRHHLTEAIKLQQEAVRSKAEFSAQLAQARQAFFDTASKPESRAPAEMRFADLLYAKDLVYMSGLLNAGTGQESKKHNAAFHMLTGGDIDGGISPAARTAFDGWINAMRESLGAKHPNQFILVTNEGQLRAALDAAAPAYARYKQLRDQFEIDRFTTGKAVGMARVAPGSFALHEQQHGTLDLAADMRLDLLGQTRPLRSQLAELSRGGQQVLRCAYGPKAGYADGTPQYEHVLFWLKQAPEGIEQMLSADTANGMARLRTRVARDKCPDTSSVAKAIWSGGEAAGRAQAAKTPQQLEDEQRAAAQAASAEWRAANAARNAAQAERMQAQQAAAEQARQAERDAMEQRKQAQIDANAARLQGNVQRQCADARARLETARAQAAAAPPHLAERHQARLQAMERAEAQRCGGA